MAQRGESILLTQTALQIPVMVTKGDRRVRGSIVGIDRDRLFEQRQRFGRWSRHATEGIVESA